MEIAPDGSALAALRRIQLVPTIGRRFDVDEATATRQYGLPAALLDWLVASGLPCHTDAGQRRFDRNDLGNVSLDLGRPSIRRMAMRTWAQALAEADLGSARDTVKIDGLASLATSHSTHHPGAPLTIETQTDTRPVEVSADLRGWLESFNDFHFFMLPECVRWNLAFIRTHRICECGGAARLLLDQARQRGQMARLCFGLLLAQPYSTGHYWTELFLNGEWVPFDPLLLRLLHRVTSLSALQWPVHRSNRPLLHRLCVVDRFDALGAPVVAEAMEGGRTVLLRVMAGQTFLATLPTSFSRETLAESASQD